jgi:uroporphyrinogen-III decarboxylase
MYEVLQDYEVPCEVIVVPDRSISNISDVVIASELNYCIKTGNQYIFAFDLNSNFTDFNPDVTGQSGYAVKVSRKEKAQKAVPVTLPGSNANANGINTDLSASFDDDMENLVTEDKTTVKGNLKATI